jgi:transposase
MGCPMPKHIQVRSLTDEEHESIKRLAHSRTEPARRVERAAIIWRSRQGERVAAIARSLGIHEQTVRLWIARFTKDGLAGLEDLQRAGRKPIYTAEQAGAVVTAALTDPQTLGLPFASWTLDRLQAYLNDQQGIPIKRGRIDQMLLAEGLRWRKQETWFGERVDPEFAEKRGASPRSTKRRPKAASSSV